MRRIIKRVYGVPLVALIILFSLPGTSTATAPAGGEFHAAKACPAYQSMRKRTNPGDISLAAGRSYSVVEVDRASGPSWYRVVVDGAEPRERWVRGDCGSAKVTAREAGAHSGAGQGASGGCNVAGEEDSYVFAVSWQPAFCAGHRDKPECGVRNPDSYQARNFTLHGLWPNKTSCGTHYGFCGDRYSRPVRPFCAMEPVPMDAAVLKRLGVVMPSAAYGSCLQRHEWYKHGTCQTEWDAGGYFNEAMRLLAEFNGSGNGNGKGSIAAFMVSHLGKRVRVDALNGEIDRQFGAGAHERMQYSCNRSGMLQDIYISLPAKLGNQGLGALIQKAPKSYANKCGDTFVVDPITN